jgi:hypothetical protein
MGKRCADGNAQLEAMVASWIGWNYTDYYEKKRLS